MRKFWTTIPIILVSLICVFAVLLVVTFCMAMFGRKHVSQRESMMIRFAYGKINAMGNNNKKEAEFYRINYMLMKDLRTKDSIQYVIDSHIKFVESKKTLRK